MRYPFCLCVCVSLPINATTSLYEAHLKGVLHKSLPSVCVSVCVSLLSLQGNGTVNCIPLIAARQRLSKHIPAARNTCNSTRNVGRVILYAVRILSKESPWIRLCVPLSQLSNNSAKTFPRQEELLKASFSMRFVLWLKKLGSPE
jgi:hypothetical protein